MIAPAASAARSKRDGSTKRARGHDRGSSASKPGWLATRGDGACWSTLPTPRCATQDQLRGADAVAVSPDGRNVYVGTFDDNGIRVYARDSRTGALEPLSGRFGCINRSGADGCLKGRGLGGVSDIVVSPDGRNVYVASPVSNAIAEFKRDRKSGALRAIGGRGSCIGPRSLGCRRARSLGGVSGLAVSPDGRNLYAAAIDASALTTFKRSGRNGALTQLSGATGCVRARGRNGCEPGRALGGARDVAVSPDGRNVYVASFTADSIAMLYRVPETGVVLQAPDARGCIGEGDPDLGCTPGRALLAPSALAIGGDEPSTLYVASFNSNAVAVLQSDADGVLSQRPGTRGCRSSPASDGCAEARGLNGATGIALSPGDRELLVTSVFDDTLTTFKRLSGSGSLKPLRGRRGCLTAGEIGGCARLSALASPWAVAVAPDDRHAYVASTRSGSITTLARRWPPPKPKRVPQRNGGRNEEPRTRPERNGERQGGGGRNGERQRARQRNGGRKRGGDRNGGRQRESERDAQPQTGGARR